MKIYTIIGGVDGVGKISLTGVLTAENRDLGVIIDTEKITASFGGDKIKGRKAAIENRNGQLITRGDVLPQWISELKCFMESECL